MIRKAVIVGLSLVALTFVAGGVVHGLVPVRWDSGPHPRLARPVLTLGLHGHLSHPRIVYVCSAPPGGHNVEERFWYWAGIRVNTQEYALGMRVYDIRFPLWMPIVLFGSYPTAHLLLRAPLRRYRRRRRGLCVACGYDLTGNVSGTCPECATEAKRP